MKTTSIYVQSLELENIRAFGDNAVLHFEKDEKIPQWTLILGDNGIGKSTLLQCIAWMKPYFPHDEDDEDTKKELNGLNKQPIISDEENETLKRLVRIDCAKSETASAKINVTFVANKHLNKHKAFNAKNICKAAIKIELLDGNLEEVYANIDTRNESTFYDNEIIIYAYSSSRQLGKLNVDATELKDTIPSFIAENTVLYDAEEILHNSNYAALGAETEKEKELYLTYLGKIKKMLVSLLPDVNKVNDIRILAPQLLNKKERGKGIMITTKHGPEIPFSSMSMGYRAAISWAIDLAWRLFKRYPDSQNPLAEPAIVLIDEIDLHLHPVWQRQIMGSLSKHFKNTQFIATAHSPLMVQAAMDANHAVLKQNHNGVTILNNPRGIDGWRIDQILTSEMFGLESARGIWYEKLYRQREKLVKRERLHRTGEFRSTEKDELNRINEQLSALPSGENPEEIDNRKFISDVVSSIKKRGGKIEL